MAPDVFAQERQEQIARLAEEHGRVRVLDLAESFAVSTVTIRKDLLALEHKGRVQRTHGGALGVERNRPERGFDVRERLHGAEKAGIAIAAVDLISDGESIALDASTTALYLARELRSRGGWSQLTVVTNGLRIAVELAGYPGITVAMPGGRVRSEALSLVGGLGDASFEQINVQTAFVGAAGFTVESGLSDATEDEARIKRAMIGSAREVVAIVDHTKWGRAAFETFCPTDRITRVITDLAAPTDQVDRVRAENVHVELVAPFSHSTDRPLSAAALRALAGAAAGLE